MATKNCPKCGKELADIAIMCPECGHKFQKIVLKKCKYCNTEMHRDAQYCPNCKKKQKGNGLWVGLGIFFLICIIGATSQEESDTISDNSTQIVSETKNTNIEPTPKPTPQPTEAPTPAPTPTETKEEFIASCQEMSYKTLARNPEDYIGSKIVLTVKIEQILQGGFFDDNQYYRVYTNDEYDLWLGDEYFMYDSRVDSDMKLLEEDIIKVYARFLGTETVKRALTNTKEDVPAFEAVYIDLISE